MKSLQKRISSINILLAIFLFSIALLGCKESPPSYTTSDVTLHKYNWQGDVPTKRKVRLINRYGNISTRNTNQSNIEIAGVIQKVGTDAPTPEVKVVEQDGVMNIEVFYKTASIDKYNNRIGRIDLGIYVPKGVSLELITDFGDIKAKKHRSKIIAKTQTGKIKLSTHNVFQALSYSGDISLDLLNWKRPRFPVNSKKNQYEAFTREGDIKIYFKNTISLSIHAESGNGIHSYDKNLNQANDSSDSLNFNTQFGSGERELFISTPKGKVEFNVGNVDVAGVSTPQSSDVNLTDLTPVNQWRPGDAVVEISDGREIDLSKTKSRDKEIEDRPHKRY